MNNKNMRQVPLKDKVSGKGTTFAKKLKTVVREGELEYWWERGNPPNEEPDVFRTFVRKLSGDIDPLWAKRKSEAGNNSLLGEKECFSFQHEISLFGSAKKFYVKGYFFDENNLKGVVIQSFREIKLQLTLAN